MFDPCKWTCLFVIKMRFRFRVFSLIVVGQILFFSLLWIPHFSSWSPPKICWRLTSTCCFCFSRGGWNRRVEGELYGTPMVGQLWPDPEDPEAWHRSHRGSEQQPNRLPPRGCGTHLQRWRSRSSDTCTRGTIRRCGHWCHQMAYWEVSSASCWCSNVGLVYTP